MSIRCAVSGALWRMVAILCVNAVSLSVLSAQEQDTIVVRQLEAVSVNALRPSREVIPPQRLQKKQLERLNSFSIADAVRYFAGVQVKDYGGIGGLKTVDVRSMGTNHMGVFYDGIQLGNAQNGQIDLGKFSLDNMEEVALYNGQKSNIFQPAKDFGSAGSLYLVSLKPRFDSMQTSKWRGSFKTGSFGLLNPSVLWQQKISSHLSSTLNAEYTYAHGRYKFRYEKEQGYDTTAIRKNGDVNAFRAEGGLYGTLKNGQWNAKAYFYNAERGLPGSVVNNVFSHIDRLWDRNFFVQSSFRKDSGKRYSLLLNAKFAADYTRYLAPDTASLYIDNHYRQQELYFSAAQQYILTPSWSIALSGDFQWNRLDADLINFSYPTRYTTLTAAASSWHVQRFKAQASLLGTFVRETVQKNKAADPHDELTPALFLSWQPFPKNALQVRAFYKRIFRMPTFNDLYYTEIGNSNLQPEFATQYNAGLSYSFIRSHHILRELSLETDVYYNEISQKIVAMPTTSQFRWTMMNLGAVQIRGIDLKTRCNWLWNAFLLQTRLNYTFQRAQDFTDPGDSFYGDQILYIPRHSGSLVLNLSWKNWDADYSLLYTGERYNGKANIPENHMQPWYTSDLTLARSFRLQRLECRISGQCNNVFNQFYDVVINYPMPGRNVKFILAVNL